MRMSVRRVVTGVTRTLGVGTSSDPISASVPRASTEMGSLVSVSMGWGSGARSSNNAFHVNVPLLAALVVL